MNKEKTVNQLNELTNKLKYDFFNATVDKKSEYKECVFSTLTKNNKPNSRTVIFREFSEDWILKIHSDLRSEKIEELKKNKNVCLLFYNKKEKIQVRITGKALIKKNDKSSWDSLSDWSKKNYISNNKPGNKINSKDLNKNIDIKNYMLETGIKNFCSISVKINEIDWLRLLRNKNIRAKIRIKRKPDIIVLEKKWVEP